MRQKSKFHTQLLGRIWPVSKQKLIIMLASTICETKKINKEPIFDIGSGLSSPALRWASSYPEIEISCVNINYLQLQTAKNSLKQRISNRENLSWSTQNDNFWIFVTNFFHDNLQHFTEFSFDCRILVFLFVVDYI